jgi:hypothetical protein
MYVDGLIIACAGLIASKAIPESNKFTRIERQIHTYSDQRNMLVSTTTIQ